MAPSAKKQKMISSQLKSNAFSTEEDEILIELVAQNPTLYDVRLESYKDGLKKQNIWKDIGSALNKTSDDCKKRWKHIKDSYNRYKRKKKTGKGTATLPKTSKWEFYERLKFLELPLSPREGISNIPSLSQDSQNDSMDIAENEDNDIDRKNNNDDDDDHDDDIQCTQGAIVSEPEDEGSVSKENENIVEETKKQNIINIKTAASKKKTQIKQDECLQCMKKMDVQRQALLKQACQENVEKSIYEDDVNSFGDYIKSVLKKLPPMLKVKAKTEIFNVMSKYELMSMETRDSAPSTSFMPNYSTYIVPSPITSPTPSQQTNYDNECV